MDENNTLNNNAAGNPQPQAPVQPQPETEVESQPETETPSQEQPVPAQPETGLEPQEEPVLPQPEVEAQPQEESVSDQPEKPETEEQPQEQPAPSQPGTETEEQPEPEVQKSEQPQPTTPPEEAQSQLPQDKTTEGSSDSEVTSQGQKKPKNKSLLVAALVIIVIVVVSTVVAVVLLTGNNNDNKVNASLDSVKSYCKKNGLIVDEGVRETEPKLQYVRCQTKDSESDFDSTSSQNGYGIISNQDVSSDSKYISIDFSIAEKPLMEYEQFAKEVKEYDSILENSEKYVKAYMKDVDMVSYMIISGNACMRLEAASNDLAKSTLIELGYPDENWPNGQDSSNANNSGSTSQNSQGQTQQGNTSNNTEINDDYFVSDGTKYVLTIESDDPDLDSDEIVAIRTHFVYTYSGEKITGEKTYSEFKDADTAKRAYDSLEESSEDLTNISVNGKYIIVTAEPDEYEGMTASDVKAQIEFMESLANGEYEEE